MTGHAVKIDQTALVTPRAIPRKGEKDWLGDFAVAFRPELRHKEIERLAVSVKR